MFEIEKTQPNFITVFPRIVSPLKSFRGNYSIYEVKNAIMRKLYENFHIFHFQKKIRGIRVYQFKNLYTRWAQFITFPTFLLTIRKKRKLSLVQLQYFSFKGPGFFHENKFVYFQRRQIDFILKQDSKELSPRLLENTPKTFNSKKPL